MPTMVYRLFSVKHLIEIIPLKFPMGFPSKEEFDPAACKINHKGEFYYHPKLKVDTKNATPRTPMVLHVSFLYRVSFCNPFYVYKSFCRRTRY